MCPVDFWQGVRDISWRRVFFSNSGVGTGGLVHTQKYSLTCPSHLYVKISLQWMIDLGVESKTVKLLEANGGGEGHNAKSTFP